MDLERDVEVNQKGGYRMDIWLWIIGIVLILIGVYLIRRAWRMDGLPDIEDISNGEDN